jgi:hypothetical protein
MRDIRNAAGSSKAGYVGSALGELKTRMRQVYQKGPNDPLPPVQLQLDFTDLLPRESSGKAICGKGESRMGDLSDGPDLAARLSWAADIDKLLTNVNRVPLDTDVQIRLISVAQTILECGEQAFERTRAISHQLQLMKGKQVKAARTFFKNSATPLPFTSEWEELLERAKTDKVLASFVYVSASMAKSNYKLERVIEVHNQADTFVTHIQTWLQHNLPIQIHTFTSAQVK